MFFLTGDLTYKQQRQNSNCWLFQLFLQISITYRLKLRKEIQPPIVHFNHHLRYWFILFFFVFFKINSIQIYNPMFRNLIYIFFLLKETMNLLLHPSSPTKLKGRFLKVFFTQLFLILLRKWLRNPDSPMENKTHHPKCLWNRFIHPRIT